MRGAVAEARAVLLLVGALALAPGFADSQEKVYEIASLDARLELLSSGAYRIREEITFDFQSGSFTFAEREIRTSNSDGVANVRVTSADLAITAVTEVPGGRHAVRWEFPPATGLVTFVVEYEIVGAVREIDGSNEVFWRVVGEDWDVPFRDVAAEVVLPAELGIDASAVTLDPAEIATLSDEGGGVSARFVVGPLPAEQAYQVRVSFPRVMDGRLTGLARPEIRALVAGLAFLILFASLGGVVASRRAGPRLGPQRGGTPDVPLHVAAVLLHTSGPGWERAFAATLFDLAARGVVSLERTDLKGKVFSSEKTLVHRHESPDEPLTAFESALLDEIDQYDTLEDFGSKGDKFRTAAMKAVRGGMVGAGYLQDDRKSANQALLIGSLLLLLGVVAGVMGAATNPLGLLLGGALVGVGIGAFLVGSVRFPRTQKGAASLSRLRGFLERIRGELEGKSKTAPLHAAQVLFQELPWVTLDPKYHGGPSGRIQKRLKKEPGPLSAPAWAIDNTRAAAKATARYSTAYAAYFPFVHVTGGAGGATAPSAGAGAAGGAAGGGAAGGGGGGAG